MLNEPISAQQAVVADTKQLRGSRAVLHIPISNNTEVLKGQKNLGGIWVMNKCISHFKMLKFISRANFFPRAAARLTAGCQ